MPNLSIVTVLPGIVKKVLRKALNVLNQYYTVIVVNKNLKRIDIYENKTKGKNFSGGGTTVIYDKGEIVREYRAAKDPKKQVKILAELNGCHPSEIAQILFEEGCMSKRSAGQYKRSPQPAAKSKVETEPETVTVKKAPTVDTVVSADEIEKPENSLSDVVKNYITEQLAAVQPKSDFKEDPVFLPVDYNAEIKYMAFIKHVTDGLNGFEGFCIGNALQLLCDWDITYGVEELEKAVWYLNRLIEQVKD